MQPQTTPISDPHKLRQAWQALLVDEPRLRIRDAAQRLEVHEAELRATECGGSTVRLNDDFQEILLRVPLLGEVMALTRNTSAVHEKVGVYPRASFNGPHGLMLGEDIDLRLFLNRWDSAYAGFDGAHPSLNFFDRHGDAVHKIHLRDSSDRGEFDRLVEIFRGADQSPHQRVTPAEPSATPRPDSEIDVPAFQAAWLAMQDTHEFFGLLRKHDVTRTQALRLAPPGHGERVVLTAPAHTLAAAAGSGSPIMVFVGSIGCIQIHTGPVVRVAPMGPWLNVMDPGFNLHLRADQVREAWIVRKPTSDGIVSSLELFDGSGETIAMLFGARKPGKPEDERWRELLAGVPRLA